LWKIASDQSGSSFATVSRNPNQRMNPFSGCRSRWSSGNATWIRRHPGHGLQLPDHLLPRLSQMMGNPQVASAATLTTISPHGRRSLSHWAYNGNLYISFGTVRCQTAEQWQLHFHDVWRYRLSDNVWTQVTTECFADDAVVRAHWPSARRRAVASLYLPCPHVSGIPPNHVPTLFRPLVYVFGGTQPRVLDKHGTMSACRTRRPSMTAPARPYTLFTSGIPSVSNTEEPVTQNRLLGLGDGDSVSLLNLPGANSSLVASSSTTITSPMAILLVNSPRTFHTEQSTPFYLVMIVPGHIPTSLYGSASPKQSCQHQSALSHLCVVSFAELGALFRTPLDSAMPLDSMCYGSLDKLLYTSEPDLEVDQVQLYTALRLAWLAVLNRSQSADSLTSVVDMIGGSRLHMLIVQQQLASQTESILGASVSGHSALDFSDPTDELSCAPLILEQHSYVLAPDGQVLRESLDCVQGFLWFTLLPLVCSALITTVDLLLESTRRLLVCLRQGNLRSFVLGPLVFRSTSPCPDCNASEQHPVHVWIDSSQLTGLIPVREPASNNNISSGRPESRNSRDCRHQTIASLLIQFLPHLRSTLELEFATKHLPGDAAPRITEPVHHSLLSPSTADYNVASTSHDSANSTLITDTSSK
uniref:Transmembrane protein n=1 Tax=Echinostoma caproni TaxID=27848 RepID=A0A183AUH2_9TREM